MEYSICTNYLEIVAGTNNTLDPVYREAAENIAQGNQTGLGYLKNFITDIESIAGHASVKDERISKSRGNIENFPAYTSICTAMDFLKKNLKSDAIVADCIGIYNALETNKALYSDGYDKQIRLIILEYENALYLLVTALSMLMATEINPVLNGTAIVIKPRASKKTFGIIPKTLKELNKQIGTPNHKKYLEEIIKTSEDGGTRSGRLVTEGVLSDAIETVNLIDAICQNAKKSASAIGRIFKSVKSTVFGIVPLIRSIIYLRYKKKADTIKALEEQAYFISQNIEQLRNTKNMNPEKKAVVIKQQTAVCEAFLKKAEKLRAELCETEKAAATEIKKSDDTIGKPNKSSDDDFVLEFVLENIENFEDEDFIGISENCEDEYDVFEEKLSEMEYHIRKFKEKYKYNPAKNTITVDNDEYLVDMNIHQKTVQFKYVELKDLGIFDGRDVAFPRTMFAIKEYLDPDGKKFQYKIVFDKLYFMIPPDRADALLQHEVAHVKHHLHDLGNSFISPRGKAILMKYSREVASMDHANPMEFEADRYAANRTSERSLRSGLRQYYKLTHKALEKMRRQSIGAIVGMSDDDRDDAAAMLIGNKGTKAYNSKHPGRYFGDVLGQQVKAQRSAAQVDMIQRGKALKDPEVRNMPEYKPGYKHESYDGYPDYGDYEDQ